MTDRESIRPFFDKTGYDHTTLVHCAAVVTIASKANPAVWSVNVGGTSNVMQLALENQTDRVIYVSSVHAIPERPGAEVITEVDHFSPDAVCGQYAKAKAAATQMVLEYAKRGLNVSVVHPSGIIGPGDFYVKNHMIKTIRAMAKGTIPVSISGGFDFVDSRDVAEGILRCEALGKRGECYILNGHYVSIRELLNLVRGMVGKKAIRFELPYRLGKAVAAVGERVMHLLGEPDPVFTPYAIYTLNTNGRFSHEKARAAFGYQTRDLAESIRASL